MKVYLDKLLRKLGVNDRLDMALYALKNHFVAQAQGQNSFGPRSLPPQVRDRTNFHILNLCGTG